MRAQAQDTQGVGRAPGGGARQAGLRDEVVVLALGLVQLGHQPADVDVALRVEGDDEGGPLLSRGGDPGADEAPVHPRVPAEQPDLVRPDRGGVAVPLRPRLVEAAEGQLVRQVQVLVQAADEADQRGPAVVLAVQRVTALDPAVR